ncbi:FAD/NAD(P)-binding domain-containing protein [Microthyrium microscopicum]|uniref:FAD/NAD(P)-binding domain-containing protein n=1 Tax=Microthyrium microscopicum TaxID=703497 RepID=A0A6A6TX18_9PEZI|nr:FAD/NAD(P)-binding domain-containing protein [Microthyrium microscopicum]
MATDYKMRVIIAGGGVVGLVLANALEQAGIDYILLERRDEISPTIGQSIAAEPNGARILDQLGILDEWKKQGQALIWWYERDNNGEVLLKTDGVKLGGSARTGYDFIFGERTKYLTTFYENLKDKSKILLSKNIKIVEETDSGVVVKCEDGTSYEGDILAGADGVRSKVREEMWRLANSQVPKVVEHDRNAMFAEYRALFGISEAPPGILPGDCDFGYDKNRSTLVFGGARNKAYVFIFEKLDKICRGRDIPRFTKEEAMAFVKKHSDFKIRPDLTIADFWKRIDNYSFVCLEECVFKLWTWGRIACVGDSVHKMTPNIGAGGNAGIESAAALANAIKWVSENSNGQRPSKELVEKALQKYQTQREARAAAMVHSAGEVTRMQAGRSFYHKFAAKMVRLYPGDFIADYLSAYFSGAEMLSYLPPPKASVGGHQPFNPSQGWSRHESKLKRAVLALPFLAMFFLANKVMTVANVVPMLTPMIQDQAVTWNMTSMPLRTKFYNVKPLDDIWVPINIFFTPALYGFDAICRTQTLSLLADYGIIVAIWAFESVRRANILTFAQIPGLFTFLGQLRGVGVISPFYYLLHYISSPVENMQAADMRLGRLNYALVLLPTLLLTHYIPGYAMFHWPTFSGRESWLFLWQMFPVWVYLTAKVLSSFIPDTTLSDRFESPTRDLPVIKYTIGTLAAVSSTVWVFTCTTALLKNGISGVFLPDGLPGQATDFVTFTREYLQFDEIFLFGNTFIWLAYLFWDLKHAGMIKTKWIQLVFYLISSVLVMGPGTTAGLGWLWRETVLANTRHRDAVIRSPSEKSDHTEKMVMN